MPALPVTRSALAGTSDDDAVRRYLHEHPSLRSVVQSPSTSDEASENDARFRADQVSGYAGSCALHERNAGQSAAMAATAIREADAAIAQGDR